MKATNRFHITFFHNELQPDILSHPPFSLYRSDPQLQNRE